jgi:choline dehydrogenase-like flavoprotein
MNLIDPRAATREPYDVVVIGSGFGASFFLHGLLRADAARRVLVLEWGDQHPHAWQIEQQRNSAIDAASTFQTPEGHKEWVFDIGLGGGTNCWWGQAPRLHPSDFELKSRYGVGRDWPLSYAELEPYYAEAETIMAISGDPDLARIFPRSRPYPQPPHHMSTIDQMMKAAQPEAHFCVPTARARLATDQRPACCANSRCGLCPVDAKFTAANGMGHVYDDPRVEIALHCRVDHLETTGGAVTGVVFVHDGEPLAARGELIVLGANAIHSPPILLRSGIDGAVVGKGLHEQRGIGIEVLLDGLDNFDGGTLTTGVNLSLYDGDFRRDGGAAQIYFLNHWMFQLRADYGRWRQTLPLIITIEDVPQDTNFVGLSPDDERPFVSHEAFSGYAQRGAERALAKLPEVLAPLPVERIEFRHWQATEAHLQGTLRMGTDPARSVVDADLVHHRLRNLLVVGTAVFPTCSPANPSLTAAALSLRAAARLSGVAGA